MSSDLLFSQSIILQCWQLYYKGPSKQLLWMEWNCKQMFKDRYEFGVNCQILKVCLFLINLSMKSTAKQIFEPVQFSSDHFPPPPDIYLNHLNDQNSLLLQPTCSYDNLFDLRSPHHQIDHFYRQNQAQFIEQGLKLLVHGQQQALIQIYEKKIKQGEKKYQQKIQNSHIRQQQGKIGQTKNIPKNFGKQIIKFVKKNRQKVETILLAVGSSLQFEALNSQLQKRKSKMNKIGDLRQLWLQKSQYGRQIRIISNYFLRFWSLNWIFNSRVVDFGCHVKYRGALLKSIEKPEEFINLKADI